MATPRGERGAGAQWERRRMERYLGRIFGMHKAAAAASDDIAACEDEANCDRHTDNALRDSDGNGSDEVARTRRMGRTANPIGGTMALQSAERRRETPLDAA